MVCAFQRFLVYQFLVLDEVTSKKHLQQQLGCFFKHMSTVKFNRKLCTTYFPSSLLLLGSELTQGLTDRDFRAM